MITPIARQGVQSAIGRNGSRPVRTISKSFQNQFSGLIQNASGRATLKPSATKASAASVLESATSVPVARQETVAAATPSATPAAASNQATQAPAATCVSSVTQAAYKQLTAALQAAGIDPTSLNIVPHDDVAYYPGTSWTNHLITLTANGHTENFSADLMLLNPNVSVTEIKGLLAMA